MAKSTPFSSTSTTVSARDRRRAERYPLNAKGQMYLCPPEKEDDPLCVLVKDVSETGIGVVFNQSLPIGQEYVVKESTIEERDSVLFTVVRSDPMGDGKYSIGLQSGDVAKTPCAGKCSLGVKGVATMLALALAISAVAVVCLR